MKILLNENNVVIDKGITIEETAQGIVVDNTTTYAKGLTLIIKEVESLPLDLSYSNYCYTVENGFYLNPNYVIPFDIDKVVRTQQVQIKSMQSAINALLSI